MGDGEDRRPEPPEELPQLHDEPLPQPPVELAERLVEHQEPGPGREGAGQRHPLLLAAGERGDGPPLGPGEADEVEQLPHPPGLLGLPGAPHPQPEGDVAGDVPLREQLVVLEHQADAPPVHRHPGLVGAAEQHPAAVERLEPGDGPQHRGLAAAAGAEHAHDLVLGDLQVHGVQHGPLPEPYGRVLDRKHQNSPEVRSVRSRSSSSRDTAHTTIRIVERAIACP